MSIINTNKSVKGEKILDFIKNREKLNGDARTVADNLLFKYLLNPDGTPKLHTKIYPDVYYYVNHNNHMNPEVYSSYIVRDQVKTPRHVLKTVINRDIVNTITSYSGRYIKKWAYYWSASPESPYYEDASIIITRYLEVDVPIGNGIYYFVKHNRKTVKLFRDLTKSPRIKRV